MTLGGFVPYGCARSNSLSDHLPGGEKRIGTHNTVSTRIPAALRTPQKVNCSDRSKIGRHLRQAGLRARKGKPEIRASDASPSQAVRARRLSRRHVATQWLASPGRKSRGSSTLAYRCGGSRGIAAVQAAHPIPVSPVSVAERAPVASFRLRGRSVHSRRPVLRVTCCVSSPCRVPTMSTPCQFHAKPKAKKTARIRAAILKKQSGKNAAARKRRQLCR